MMKLNLFNFKQNHKNIYGRDENPFYYNSWQELKIDGYFFVEYFC